MAAWPIKTIDSLCEITSSKRIFAADYVSEGVPFYRGKEITEKYKGNLEVSTELFITEKKFNEIKCKFGVPLPGDLLLTSVGTLGSVYVVKQNDRFYFKDGNLTWFRNFQGLDSQFLYYWLSSPQGKAELQKATIGSSQSAFTIVLLKKLEIELPPLPEQKRIAGILSAYDELIENSQRRIKILETMARKLYREWFVQFRFPGHEKVPLVDSPLGKIPQGWEVKTIADICKSVSYGYTAGASTEEVGPKFLRITDIVPNIIDWMCVPFCEITGGKVEKYLLQPGDIVVARTGATTGYAKRLNKRHPSTVFASYLVRVRTQRGVSNRMLGILMESDDYKKFIKANIGGSAQPQANAVILTSMQLAVPPVTLAEKFDQIIEAILDESELLAIKIQNLRRTRGLLLPRLLSGSIMPQQGMGSVIMNSNQDGVQVKLL